MAKERNPKRKAEQAAAEEANPFQDEAFPRGTFNLSIWHDSYTDQVYV